MAATAVAGAGVVHWLLRGQRTIVTVSAQLWDEIRRASAAAVAVEQPALAGNEAELRAVAAPLMTRYHRPSCDLAVGKPGLTEVSAEDIEGRELRPCGACCP